MLIRSPRALFLALLLAFSASSAHAAKLYVVYASIGGTQAVGWVAREAGLFAKHGLDVEMLFTGGGRAVTSLLGGGQPIVTGGGPAAARAGRRRGDHDIWLTPHIFDTILSPLMPAREIRRGGDLRGKKMGASRFGSAT